MHLPVEVAKLCLLYLEQRLWEVWGAGQPRLVAACLAAARRALLRLSRGERPDVGAYPHQERVLDGRG
jgi:hypothetical protein